MSVCQAYLVGTLTFVWFFYSPDFRIDLQAKKIQYWASVSTYRRINAVLGCSDFIHTRNTRSNNLKNLDWMKFNLCVVNRVPWAEPVGSLWQKVKILILMIWTKWRLNWRKTQTWHTVFYLVKDLWTVGPNLLAFCVIVVLEWTHQNIDSGMSCNHTQTSKCITI